MVLFKRKNQFGPSFDSNGLMLLKSRLIWILVKTKYSILRSNRNQSFDLDCKSIDSFLYECNINVRKLDIPFALQINWLVLIWMIIYLLGVKQIIFKFFQKIYSFPTRYQEKFACPKSTIETMRWKRYEISSKLNNKDIRTTSMASFWFLHC